MTCSAPGKMFLLSCGGRARRCDEARGRLALTVHGEGPRGRADWPGVLRRRDRGGGISPHRKSIVGVVLACNGYEVIDCAMVPAAKILEAEGCDVHRLSGPIPGPRSTRCYVAEGDAAAGVAATPGLRRRIDAPGADCSAVNRGADRSRSGPSRVVAAPPALHREKAPSSIGRISPRGAVRLAYRSRMDARSSRSPTPGRAPRLAFGRPTSAFPSSSADACSTTCRSPCVIDYVLHRVGAERRDPAILESPKVRRGSAKALQHDRRCES